MRTFGYVYVLVLGCFLLLTSKAGARPRRQFRFSEEFFHGFRTLEEINKYMLYLSRAKSNATVSLLRIGHSVESRPIKVLRIRGRNANGNAVDAVGASKSKLESTRGVLITGAVHGREWITPASVLYTAARIIDAYGKPQNKSLSEALDHATLHFIPVVNPDGYAYTWKTRQPLTYHRFRLGSHTGTKTPRPAPLTRLWRGNRRRLMHGSVGVDLNRNWGTGDVNWGQGVIKSKSINFQGSSGFSEPELKAIRFYANRRLDINGFLDVHCCSQNIIAPFSLHPYNKSDADRFALLGKAYAAAMSSANGRNYVYTRRPEKRSKLSSGISSGWGLNEMGWEDSFTVELGGRFIMPAKSIVSKGKELLEVVKIALARSATTTKPVLPKVLAPFTSSSSVVQWQLFLRKEGFFSPRYKIHKIFGGIVIKSTKAWQKKNGLAQTGFVDTDSLQLANSKGFTLVVPRLSQNAQREAMPLESEFLERFLTRVEGDAGNDDFVLDDSAYFEYDEDENKSDTSADFVEPDPDAAEKEEIEQFLREDSAVLAQLDKDIDAQLDESSNSSMLYHFRSVTKLKRYYPIPPQTLRQVYGNFVMACISIAAFLAWLSSRRSTLKAFRRKQHATIAIGLTCALILLQLAAWSKVLHY